MRRIVKGEPIASFVTYSTANPGANWDMFHRDAQECYLHCRLQILLEEQNCLCGYTEISVNEVTDAHLDHYRKKSIFPALTFTWTNLIAATLDSDFGANYKDSVYKIKQDEYPNIFNPVEENVHEFFYYNQRGEIEPKPTISDDLKTKASKTIEVFNLNHPSLKSRRQTIIKQIQGCRDLPADDIIGAFSNSGFKSVILQEVANVN